MGHVLHFLQMNAEMQASGMTTGWGIMAAGSWHHCKGVPWNIELAAAGLEVDHLGLISDIYIYGYFITTSLFYRALEMIVNKGEIIRFYGLHSD